MLLLSEAKDSGKRLGNQGVLLNALIDAFEFDKLDKPYGNTFAFCFPNSVARNLGIVSPTRSNNSKVSLALINLSCSLEQNDNKNFKVLDLLTTACRNVWTC